jgi:hypothetical protein
MKVTDEYRKSVRDLLVETMGDTIKKRGSMLSPELISHFLNLSFRSIYRLKENPAWLPPAEICPTIEMFCSDVARSRDFFSKVVENWKESEFSKAPEGVGKLLFRPRYFAILQAKDIPAAAKAERLAIQILKDFVNQKEEAAEGDEAANV